MASSTLSVPPANSPVNGCAGASVERSRAESAVPSGCSSKSMSKETHAETRRTRKQENLRALDEIWRGSECGSLGENHSPHRPTDQQSSLSPSPSATPRLRMNQNQSGGADRPN